MIAEFWTHGCVLRFLLPHHSAAELSHSSLVTDTKHLLIAAVMHVLLVSPLSLGEASYFLVCIKNNNRGGLTTSISLLFQMWPTAAGLILCDLFALEAWLLRARKLFKNYQSKSSLSLILQLWIRKQLSWGLSFELVFWSCLSRYLSWGLSRYNSAITTLILKQTQRITSCLIRQEVQHNKLQA